MTTEEAVKLVGLVQSLSENMKELSASLLTVTQTNVSVQGGIRDALIYLATSIAQQSNINEKQLFDDFSALIDLNHGQDEAVPVAVLDVRAALAKVVQGRA